MKCSTCNNTRLDPDRKIPGSSVSCPTCQALNMNGNQCKNKVVSNVKYHGNNEIYENYNKSDNVSIGWVIIGVCKKHYENNFRGNDIVG